MNNLLEWCNEQTTIECTKCKKITGTWGDAYSAIEDFATQGWRATENHCYCPDCSKKYLKPIKKNAKKV